MTCSCEANPFQPTSKIQFVTIEGEEGEMPLWAEMKQMERAKGIEPSCAVWKTAVLPLNYARKGFTNHTGRPWLVNFSPIARWRATLKKDYRYRRLAW